MKLSTRVMKALPEPSRVKIVKMLQVARLVKGVPGFTRSPAN